MEENGVGDNKQALFDAVVVGAGAAGLATSYELKRRGIDHVVLERGSQPGTTWAGLYDSLVLHTGRHMSHLPGMPLPRPVPLFPPRKAFARYLLDYVRHFELPVQTEVDVTGVDRRDGRWLLTTSRGEVLANTLVMATGIVSNPYVPMFDGGDTYKGRLLHSIAYRRPSNIPGRSVLVVGVGNSGGEIASELALAGRTVDVAVRSGANVVPLTLAGIPIQYLSNVLLKFPRLAQTAVTGAVQWMSERRRGPSPLPPAEAGPLDAIPLIGFHLVDAIKAGRVGVRPGIARLTESGAVFSDGTVGAYETIILATGFRAALAPLGELVRRDTKGFAMRVDRVASADYPDLVMVGHNYDARGAIYNIARDARLAAAGVAKVLAKSPIAPPTNIGGS